MDKSEDIKQTAPSFSIPLMRKQVEILTDEILLSDCLEDECVEGRVFDMLKDRMIQKAPPIAEYLEKKGEDAAFLGGPLEMEDYQENLKESTNSLLLDFIGKTITPQVAQDIGYRWATWVNRGWLYEGKLYEQWDPTSKPEWMALRVEEIRRVVHKSPSYLVKVKAYSGSAVNQTWTRRYWGSSVRVLMKEIGAPKFSENPTNPLDIHHMWMMTLVYTKNREFTLDYPVTSSSMLDHNKLLLRARTGKCLGPMRQIYNSPINCFNCILGTDKCPAARHSKTYTENKRCMNYRYVDGEKEFHDGFIADEEHSICLDCLNKGRFNKDVLDAG